MSQIFFDELGLEAPRLNLGIHGGGHGEMTGRMLAALERIISRRGPISSLVPGDTNSTLAGALAAAKLHMPVAHLEAGLRSFNRRMPEEINRVLTDHVSTLLLCPTETARRQSAREGIVDGVHNVGDVMYDAAFFAAAAAGAVANPRPAWVLSSARYALATVHRAESTENKEALAEIVDFLRRQARDRSSYSRSIPGHAQRISEWRLDLGDILVVRAVRLSRHAPSAAIGGCRLHQFRRPAEGGLFPPGPLTLRSETEWVETIEAGWNRLWKGPDYAPAGKSTRLAMVMPRRRRSHRYSISSTLVDHRDNGSRHCRGVTSRELTGYPVLTLHDSRQPDPHVVLTAPIRTRSSYYLDWVEAFERSPLFAVTYLQSVSA